MRLSGQETEKITNIKIKVPNLTHDTEKGKSQSYIFFLCEHRKRIYKNSGMQIIMICKYKTEQEEGEECGWGSLTGSSKVAANKEQEKKGKR